MSIPEPADTEDFLPKPLQPELAALSATFDNEVQQWHQFLTQAAQSKAPSYEGSLAEACSLAAGLHLATTSIITAHPMRLQVQTDELFAAMINKPDDAWDALPMLHVRM